MREEVAIVPYDPHWPELFRMEKEHLLSCLPNELIRRIEHFGSTAVPGLAAKPIVDILVEVTDLDADQSSNCTGVRIARLRVLLARDARERRPAILRVVYQARPTDGCCVHTTFIW